MFKFNVSAPGRVFLYGSPMSYKKLSMGASINLRTRLTFSSILPGPPHFVEINFSNIMLHMKIPLQIVSAYFDTKNFDPSILTDAELHSAVKNHISSLNDYTGEYNPNNRAHQLSLEAFLFLLLRMARKESISIKSSFMVKVSTELTIGEGLGSSSSFVTCLAACFYRWSLLQKGTVIYFFEDEHLLHISKYVQSCDFIVYNSSTSKLDSSISVFGSVQLFEKEAMANLHCNIPNMKILLVFSNVSQKTMTEQGEHMERMLQSYPFVESIQKSIDEVVEKSTEIFEDLETSLSRLNDVYNITCDSDEDLYELFPKSSCEQLSILIQLNQGLLRALGMSHPNLEIICAIAKKFSLAGKLMCNGGGGYAIILLLPNTTDELINQLLNELKCHNFSIKITKLNCSGVRIE